MIVHPHSQKRRKFYYKGNIREKFSRQKTSRPTKAEIERERPSAKRYKEAGKEWFKKKAEKAESNVKARRSNS